jgi:hypothetical protein
MTYDAVKWHWFAKTWSRLALRVKLVTLPFVWVCDLILMTLLELSPSLNCCGVVPSCVLNAVHLNSVVNPLPFWHRYLSACGYRYNDDESSC